MFKMKCPNCGQMIPVAGKVCPFCHADKTAAAKSYQTAGVLLAGVIAVAAVGGWAFAGVGGFLLGTFGGMFVGVIVAALYTAIARQ